MTEVDRGTGSGAPGRGVSLPADMATHRHALIVRLEYPDGWVKEFRAAGQAGEAGAAHDRLAKRWRSAKYVFDRDRKARTLGRQNACQEYRETVTHEPEHGSALVDATATEPSRESSDGTADHA